MFSRRRRATVDIPVRKSVLGRKLAEGLYVLQDGADVFCDVVIYNDALRSFPFDGTTGACTGFVRTLSKKFPRARILLVSSNDALVGLSRSPSLPSVDGDSADISTRLEDLRSACEMHLLHPTVWIVMETKAPAFRKFLSPASVLANTVQRILFLGLEDHSLPIGRTYVEALNDTGNHSFELFDFISAGTTYKDPQASMHFAYTRFDFPVRPATARSASRREARYDDAGDDLHFLLGGTCAQARHANRNWSPECSTTFWDTLRYGVESCATGGRNVYVLSSPLRLGGAGDAVAVRRENHARVQIRHWKVLVTRLSPEEFYARVARGNFDGEDVWGSMHELRNNRYTGRCRHNFKGRFTAAHFRGITDWKCLGKTFLRDSELNALGNSIVTRNPRYDVLSNNCQTFAKEFTQEAVPGSRIPWPTFQGPIGGRQRRELQFSFGTFGEVQIFGELFRRVSIPIHETK